MDHKALTAENIARESAKIGGFFPTKRNERDPEYVALKELYAHVLCASEPQLTSPLISNTAICGSHGQVQWRTGIPAEFRGLPKAEACRHLFYRWWRRVVADMERVRLHPDQRLREHDCLTAYAEFLCIRPFRNANGRTALLLFYMLRQYAGLPLILVEYERAPDMLHYVKEYRKEIFFPTMRGRRFMRDSAG